MDPRGLQPGLVDTSSTGGVWQGPPPATQLPAPSHLIPPHHPAINTGRMPPRDLHFA